MYYINVLLKSHKFVIGAFVLVSIIMLAILYPFINTADPKDLVAMAFEPPREGLILGTDNFGRDVFLQLAHGTRTSMYVGLLAGIVATSIGLILGLMSGYIGGLIDDVITTFTNMFIVIPSFIILIVISVSLDVRSATLVSLIIGFTTWPWTARAVRAQTSSLRNREHVNIAKISGYTTPRIIFSEILPYMASYVVMAFALQIAAAILAEAGISMLGLGPHDTISLGVLMQWALLYEAPATGAWWAFMPAALFIAAISFSLNYMNSGMDEIFNPKIRGN